MQLKAKIFWDAVIAVCMIVLIICGIVLYKHFHDMEKNNKEFKKIAATAEKEPWKLKRMNKDMIGYLKMDGTVISYPVMKSGKDNPDFYLDHNFKKEKTISGSLFLDANTKLSTSLNYIIYGHRMWDGSMFGSLQHDIKDRGKRTLVFYRFLNDKGTVYEKGTYEIFSAYKTATWAGDEYYTYANIEKPSDFKKYVDVVSSRSEIRGKKPKKETQLVTLSTCSYHLIGRNGRIDHSGRFVAMAKLEHKEIIRQ